MDGEGSMYVMDEVLVELLQEVIKRITSSVQLIRNHTRLLLYIHFHTILNRAIA